MGLGPSGRRGLWPALALMAGLGLGGHLYADSPRVTPDRYQVLCREMRAVTGVRFDELKTRFADVRGRCLELGGTVVAQIGLSLESTEPAGTCLLQLQVDRDDCVNLRLPSQLPEIEPGMALRLLARLPETAESYDECVILALCPASLLPPMTFYTDGEPAVQRPPAPEQGTTTTITQQPVVVPRLPQPSASAGVVQRWQAATQATAPNQALPPELRGAATLGGGDARPQTTATTPQQPAAATYTADQRVARWAAWIRQQNPNCSDELAANIAGWTIWHAYVNGVDHRLVFAVIKCESCFNPRDLSSAGAMGLMQLMPFNCKAYGLTDPYAVDQNIGAGVKMLAGYLRRYADRPPREQTELALACYNAGSGAVAKAGGIPPYEETQNYCRKVPDLFAGLVKAGMP